MRIARKVLILALGGSTLVAGAAIAFGAFFSAASVAPAKAPVTHAADATAPSPDNFIWAGPSEAMASPDNFIWGGQ